jgi:hypothetical protein
LEQSIGETNAAGVTTYTTAVLANATYSLAQQKQGSFVLRFTPKGRVLIEGLQANGEVRGALIATVKGGKTVARSIVIVESGISVP